MGAPMNFDEYRPLAARTSDPSRGKLVNTLYAAVGLAGEWAEWTEAPTIDEAGDVCWHLAEVCRVWGFGHVVPDAGPLGPMPIRAIGIIAEASKKWACHSRKRDEFAADVHASVAHLLWVIGREHHMPDVYAHNIAKLKERHPNGFDPSYHAGDVLAGHEWDEDPGGLFVLDDGEPFSAWATVFPGVGWVVMDNECVDVAEGRDLGEEGKRCAEAALRAYIEGQQ